jgi:hypothetical protein
MLVEPPADRRRVSDSVNSDGYSGTKILGGVGALEKFRRFEL